MGLMSLTTHLYEGYVDINNEARQFSDKQIFGTPEYIGKSSVVMKLLHDQTLISYHHF
jgi:microtubule-associated serine/threonine kinase